MLKKGMIFALMLVAVLSVARNSVDAATEKNTDFSIMTEDDLGNVTQSEIITLTDEFGQSQYSFDGGETWSEYEEVTEEILLEEIERVKADLKDADFMMNWINMGRTEQELLEYITYLESDIENLKNGIVLQSARILNAEGMTDYFTSSYDTNNLEVSNEQCVSILYIDEVTGGEVYYQAENNDALRDLIEEAFNNNEISKDVRDDILLELID